MRATFTSRENRRLPRLQWVGERDSVAVDLLGVEGDHTVGRGEGSVRSLAPGAILQFERVGFARVERGWTSGTEPVRLAFGHS